jgi:hypothetical protein
MLKKDHAAIVFAVYQPRATHPLLQRADISEFPKPESSLPVGLITRTLSGRISEGLSICNDCRRFQWPKILPEGFCLSFCHTKEPMRTVEHTSENFRTTCYNIRMRPHDYAPRPAHLKWLLDSDPAIRWQVMRDLTREAPNAIAAERSRVATEGWGAQLLARQSPAGNWAGGPRGWRDDLPREHRDLLITLYSLSVLMDLGLDPASKQSRKMIDRVDKRLTFKWLNNRPYLHGETEPCINGRILGIGAYFKEPNDALANQLLGEQLEDGGWNCEAPKSRRSSFHSTICVLEGLLEYERAGRKSAAVTKARKRAENYLLERRIFRSLRSGKVIDKRWLRFSFPTFWHYDVLRGLDYLRNAGIKPDSRVREAIETVIERRHQNGRWPMNLLHPEYIPLEMETGVGTASRWNTLRSLRVLGWYNNSTR